MRWLLAFLVLSSLLGPIVIRLPLVDWTYQDGHATAGWCLWPIGIVLDIGPLGDTALGHELCHWRNHRGIMFTKAARETAERICQ